LRYRTRAAACLILFGVMGSVAQQNGSGTEPIRPKPQVVLVRLADPIYPRLAHQAHVYGTVRIGITVHPDGSTEAAVVSGHPMLKQAALESATNSRFECQNCAAPLHYSLVYAFELNSDSDCCAAFNAPVRVEQKPQSADQEEETETQIVISTSHICLCDPSATLSKRRSLKCLYLWKCSPH